MPMPIEAATHSSDKLRVLTVVPYTYMMEPSASANAAVMAVPSKGLEEAAAEEAAAGCGDWRRRYFGDGQCSPSPSLSLSLAVLPGAGVARAFSDMSIAKRGAVIYEDLLYTQGLPFPRDKILGQEEGNTKVEGLENKANAATTI